MTPTPANDNTRPQSFDALLLQYDGFIRSRCHDEDLYQDVRLMAMERWYRYRQDGNFVSWIAYLVQETLSQRARKAARQQRWLPYTPPGHTEPSQEYAADIGAALDVLPPREREAITLVSLGQHGAEVGQAMGISRERVRQLVEAGRGRLVAANDNNKVNDAAA